MASILWTILVIFGTSAFLISDSVDCTGVDVRLRSSVDRLQSLSGKPLDVSTWSLKTVDAGFFQAYNGSVRKGVIWSFLFPKTLNESTAVRVHVRAPDSNLEFPTMFVVEEQRGIMSWQVPLVLSNMYTYYNVSRTLCPPGVTTPVEDRSIMMEVTTYSKTPYTFHLSAEPINIDLQLYRPTRAVVSPSQPMYFRFKLPEGAHSVRVRVESNDSLCMVFSVQDIHCPVFDLDRNVQYTGHMQTVTRKGGMTVKRGEFTNDTFFVVLVVKPSDYECNQIETIQPITPGRYIIREKDVTITLTNSITDTQYLTAVLVATCWFLTFYVLAFLVIVIYNCVKKNRGQDEISPSQDNSERDYLVDSTGDSTNQQADNLPTYGATNDTTPVLSSDVMSSSEIPHIINSHHSVTAASHRPHNDSSSEDSPDEADIDFLNDVHHDKDIIRTKTYLYVSDLARKPRKTLARKFRLYPWTVVIIAVFYGLPVIQLVITYQKVLNETGDEDKCYYNFYCAHPLGLLSAFNNVFSNIGYMLLGFLFLILVYRRDVKYTKMINADSRLDKLYGIPQHFGVFYALGIGLVMMGILSGCYHVCPSYSNFQFDTSFMFVIAWLLMLKIYQTRHPDINPHSYAAYFVLAIVILFVVVGVVDGGLWFWVVFSITLITSSFFLSIHVYYMGRWSIDVGVIRRLYHLVRADRFHCPKPIYPDRMILLLVGNVVNWFFAIYGPIEQYADFASYLLAIFIVNLLMYFAFYIIMKLRSGERLLFIPTSFTVIASINWAIAFYFFQQRRTSWQLTPAQSREQNQDCLLLHFYDDHDIWHAMSAESMFFSFIALLYLDDDLTYTPRDRIPVF